MSQGYIEKPAVQADQEGECHLATLAAYHCRFPFSLLKGWLLAGAPDGAFLCVSATQPAHPDRTCGSPETLYRSNPWRDLSGDETVCWVLWRPTCPYRLHVTISCAKQVWTPRPDQGEY
jgi:hypothetical protein